ncbi:MAG: hypothetical protein ABIN69_01645 [Aestuariivirga sp.]
MTKIVAAAIQKTPASSVRKFVRGVFTFDPAASRMLDDTFVQVHLSSRIWMV